MIYTVEDRHSLLKSVIYILKRIFHKKSYTQILLILLSVKAFVHLLFPAEHYFQPQMLKCLKKHWGRLKKFQEEKKGYFSEYLQGNL